MRDEIVQPAEQVIASNHANPQFASAALRTD
jgi:hypothetical protein